MELVLKIILDAVALLIGAKILRGVEINSFGRALIVAVVVGLLNLTLGAVLNFVTTPIRWLTLGLFSFVVSAIIILIADRLLKGFEVKGFFWAIALAVIVSIISWITYSTFGIGD